MFKDFEKKTTPESLRSAADRLRLVKTIGRKKKEEIRVSLLAAADRLEKEGLPA